MESIPALRNRFNYFDALTRFYIAADIGSRYTDPSQCRLDGFRIYHEPYEENELQVYAVSGVFVSEENRLIVTWNRNKEENVIDHEVRYAFSNIHEPGWDNATTTGGPFDTKGYTGYNNVHWGKNDISMGNNIEIYVAIKPVNSDLF